MKKNKFSKALKHLKSKKIDEKIKGLEEAAPTNSMSGVYQVTPSTGDAFRMGVGDPDKKFYPKQDGTWPSGIPANASDTVYIRKGGYYDSGKGAIPDNQTPTSRDFTYDDVTNNGSSNTDTFIRPSDGKPYTSLPPNSESFILGPLVGNYAINHGDDDFTNIGYIQKDTRQFVLLGRIHGFFKGEDRPRTSFGGGHARTFDGTASQFQSFNSNFTLEHALWMQDRYNRGDFADNFPFNFSGGIPVERHPSNSFMGSGPIFGVLNALFGGANDNIGTPQDPADVNDINSLNLAGMTYSDLPPKPKRSDYPNTRSGAAAFSRAMREWEKLEAALAKKAGLETTDPIFNQDNWETVKDAGSKIADTLWSGAKILAGLGKGKKLLADFIADYAINPLVDRAFGFSVADSAGEYNQKLLTGLGTSVLTGKNQEIKLSPKAKKDLINSIDTEMLKKHLTVGPTPVINADNAVNPGKGKQNGLLKGAWGNQGGTHINYDPSNGKFTITMVKMLRDFGELDTRQPNNQAVGGDPKITNFHDIPTPTTEQIRSQFSKVQLDKFFKLAGKYSPHRLRGFSGDDVAEAMSTRFEGFTKAAYNLVVQGSASNIVHFRNEAIKLGVPQSEIEKMGAGFGGYVYSQATFTGNDIPGNHSDKNSVTGIVNRAAMRALGIEVTESRKIDEKNKVKILREIRQPLKEIKELPKTTKLKGYRPNFKGKFSPQNTPDVTASKKSDDIVSGKNASRQVWTAKDKYWKGYETTERMNIIYDNLGHGSQFFDRIVDENVRLKKKQTKDVQEHLNMLAHQKAMREVYGVKEFEELIDESETYDNKINDPLFTKVAKRLKKEIDYPKKPAAKGYPNEAPPKVDPNSGYHPKFGKRYKYDKLDPISAKTMAGAPTGDPEIDANVKKAAKIKESWRSDLKNLWLGSERGDWKNKIKEDFANTTQGMKVGQTFTHVPSGQTVTTSGVLGGVETLQTFVPLFGDAIPGPTESQYGLQGFAKPIDLMRRGKKKTEELNKELDSSEKYTKEIKADKFMKGRVEDSVDSALLSDLGYKSTEDILAEVGDLWTYEEYMAMLDAIADKAAAKSLPITKKILEYSPTGKTPGDVPISLIDAQEAITNARNKAEQALHLAWERYNKIPEPQGGYGGGQDNPTNKRGSGFPKGESNPEGDTETEAKPEKEDEFRKARVNRRGTAEISDKQKRINKAAETFIRYLTNQLPEGKWNDYMGKDYVRHAFESGYFNNKGGVTVGDNVIGSASSLTFDQKSGRYRMNFKGLGVDDNFTQFSKGDYNIWQKAALNALGKYSADLQPAGLPWWLGSVQAAIGAGASKVYEFSKLFGGGKDVDAFIEIDAAELQKLNPSLVQQSGLVWNQSMMGTPKGSDPEVTHNYYAVYGKLPPRAVIKGSSPFNYGDHPEYDPKVIEKIDSMRRSSKSKTQTKEPSKAVNRIKSMTNTKRQSLSLDEPIVRNKKNFREWSQQLDDMWNSDWRDELKEGMTTSDTFSYSVSGKGDVDLSITGTGYTEEGVHQLANIEPMINVSDPTNAGKKFGRTHGYGGNTYGAISQYDSQSKQDAGEENRYWNNAITGPNLDDNSNLRFADYIYPFDRSATQAEMDIGAAAAKVRGDNDTLRAVYPTNVFGDRHKATPVVTNPTVGTDDDYNIAGMGIMFGGGSDTRDPRFFVPNPVNTSEIDTVQILASLPSASSITSAGTQLQLFYWSGDKPGFQSLYPANPGGFPRTNRQNDGWRPIAMKPNGETDSSVNSNLIDIEKPADYLGHGVINKFSVQLPEWCRSTSTRFMFVQLQGGSADNLKLFKVGYQRRNAITINTTLADEKASAFVRVGNNSQMSPEERKKKLNDMLKASREYMLKSLGFASLFNDEVKISDVVSNTFDYEAVMQGSGAFGNTRFNDLVSLEKRQAQSKKYRAKPKTRKRSGRFRGYQRTGRDSKGMTTRARVNPKDIIGSI